MRKSPPPKIAAVAILCPTAIFLVQIRQLRSLTEVWARIAAEISVALSAANTSC